MLSFPTTACAVAGVILLATGASGETSSRPTAFHHATPPRSFGGEGQFGGEGSQMSRLPSRESRAASPIERMKSGAELRKSTLRRPQVRTHAASHRSLLPLGEVSPRLLIASLLFTRHIFWRGHTEASRGGVGGWRCSPENVLCEKWRRAASQRRRVRLERRRPWSSKLRVLRLAVQGSRYPVQAAWQKDPDRFYPFLLLPGSRLSRRTL